MKTYLIMGILALLMLVDTMRIWGLLDKEIVITAKIYNIPEKIDTTDIEIIVPEQDLAFDFTEAPIKKPKVLKASFTDAEGIKSLKFEELELYREKITIEASDAEVKAYIKRFIPTALVDQQKFGIPASIKLAQGLLESNAGDSRLAQRVNNHFGIKTQSESGYNLHDDDPKDRFQRFSTSWESWRRHSYVITKERYKGIFESKFDKSFFEKYRNLKGCYNCKNSARIKDVNFDKKLALLEKHWSIPYKRFAYGLDICGYATDNNYAESLIKIIERNKLQKFDNVKVIL